MASTTGIEWCDSTWNPLRGCSRVSEGCRNCYAEKVAYRFSGAGQPYEGLAVLKNGHASWTGKVELVKKHLMDPLWWKAGAKLYDRVTGKCVGRDQGQPLKIFVNSMSDLFHESVPDEWLDRIFAVMALCSEHVFQVLTKRPERMLAYSERRSRSAPDRISAALAGGRPLPDAVWDAFLDNFSWPLPNVWLGVSVESPQHKDRIDILRETPAAVRMLSLEPLLADLGRIDLTGIQWVIVGGESGPGARPMHPDWARGLRDQCAAAGVAFFMKQMGSVHGPKKGHELPEDLDIKQFPRSNP